MLPAVWPGGRAPSTLRSFHAPTRPAAADATSLLDELVNYEQSGMPAAAGTSASPVFDLSRMHRLLHALGDPHLQLQAVHVAGSKGKGSTVCLLASALTAAGYRPGVYTSPHLLRLEERIAVGARPIDPDDLAFLVRHHADAVRRVAAAEGGALSHFEVMTALAFRYFADCRVDVAVVETGMGGVTDATNVFPADNLLAAVVTGLGMEHVEALGGSLTSIAEAKAGILRPRRPLVLAPQRYTESKEVLLAAAEAQGCPVVRAEKAVTVTSKGLLLDPSRPGQAVRERLHITVNPQFFEEVSSTSGAGGSSSISGCSSEGRDPAAAAGAGAGAAQGQGAPHKLQTDVGLAGPHQHGNVASAVAVVEVLQRRYGWQLPDAALVEGLAAARLPGRFQVLRLPGSGGADGPYVVLDGAHTAESAASLAASLRSLFPHPTPVGLVLAMAADKEHRTVAIALRELAPRVAVFTTVPIAGSYHRAAAPGTLAAHWQAAAILAPASSRSFRCRELVQASLGAAFDKARTELRSLQQQGEGPGVVVVTGSLHAVAAAHKLPELQSLVGTA